MKHTMVIAVLVCASPMAMAQNGATPPAKPGHRPNHAVVRAAHGALQTARRPPVVLPQQFAPPQEAFASFPEPAAAASPAQPSACQAELAKVAQFQALPILVGPGGCGAADAVALAAIVLPDQSKVAVQPAATLRCPMARQIADWVRDDVAPSVTQFGSGLRELDNLASYDCRGRDNVHAAKLSEHGRADALDVRDFKLADGRTLVLTDATVDKDWRNAVRSAACARFATVLGPGSDGYHEEHVHLDLEPRRNDYKVCEWDVREPPPPVEAQAKEPDAAPAEGVPLQGLDAPPIALADVPLPRPRPRPPAANTAQRRAMQ